MLLGFTSRSWSLEEDGVFSLWRLEGELVEGDDFSSGSKDSGAGSFGDVKSGDGDLWDSVETGIIGDSREGDNSLVLVSSLLDGAGKLGEREWLTVTTGHAESLQDDGVELLSSASSEESVELGQKTEVRVLTLWCRSAGDAIVLVVDINTHDL